MRNSLGRSKLPNVGTLLVLAFASVGCMPQLNDPDRGPLTQTFAVSDYFSPSGFMGDGEQLGLVTMEVNQGCKDRPPGARGNCYHFRYYMDVSHNLHWAGVYWVFPSNSWGSRPGYAFRGSNFKQVHFYASIESPSPNTKMGGGTSFFNGIVGQINGNGFYGTQCTPAQEAVRAMGCEYEDKIGGENSYAIGTDITGGPLQKFTLIPSDITTGMDADELIGGFAWSIDFPSDSCVCPGITLAAGESVLDCASKGGTLTCPNPIDVYLDDIIWDTTPPPAPPDAGAAPGDASSAQ